jgi:hypothetical protein
MLWGVGSAGEFRALANAFLNYFSLRSLPYYFIECRYLILFRNQFCFLKAFASAMCVSRGWVVFHHFLFWESSGMHICGDIHSYKMHYWDFLNQ